MAAGQETTAPTMAGCYLLVVLSEPVADDHKERILQKIAKGLLSWDVESTKCNLLGLENVCNEVKNYEGNYGELLIQHSTEYLAVEVLLNPQVNTLRQCLKNLLAATVGHKHLIHSGYAFAGSGSWILQDGMFSFEDFVTTLEDEEVQIALRNHPGCTIHVHCTSEGPWANDSVCQSKHEHLFINPADKVTTVPGSSTLMDCLDVVLKPQPLAEMMKSSPIVGNIRFNRPTLYVFPGGQGDCSLFGVSGFTMLIDGGFNRRPCFWEFIRHLDRLDAMMITRLNENNVCGISSMFQRKTQGRVYPQIGYVFCNVAEGKRSPSDELEKDRDELLVSVVTQGHEFAENLQQLGLKPHRCLRDTLVEPLTLFHKVGHGTLEMYVLSPPKDSTELKLFFQQWTSYKEHFNCVQSGSDFISQELQIPLSHAMSVCALLVWKPADPEDTITRVLLPGSAPQSKIFEGLEKISYLDVLKYRTCTQLSVGLTEEKIKIKTTKRRVIKSKAFKRISTQASNNIRPSSPAKLTEKGILESSKSEKTGDIILKEKSELETPKRIRKVKRKKEQPEKKLEGIKSTKDEDILPSNEIEENEKVENKILDEGKAEKEFLFTGVEENELPKKDSELESTTSEEKPDEKHSPAEITEITIQKIADGSREDLEEAKNESLTMESEKLLKETETVESEIETKKELKSKVGRQSLKKENANKALKLKSLTREMKPQSTVIVARASTETRPVTTTRHTKLRTTTTKEGKKQQQIKDLQQQQKNMKPEKVPKDLQTTMKVVEKKEKKLSQSSTVSEVKTKVIKDVANKRVAESRAVTKEVEILKPKVAPFVPKSPMKKPKEKTPVISPKKKLKSPIAPTSKPIKPSKDKLKPKPVKRPEKSKESQPAFPSAEAAELKNGVEVEENVEMKKTYPSESKYQEEEDTLQEQETEERLSSPSETSEDKITLVPVSPEKSPSHVEETITEIAQTAKDEIPDVESKELEIVAVDNELEVTEQQDESKEVDHVTELEQEISEQMVVKEIEAVEAVVDEFIQDVRSEMAVEKLLTEMASSAKDFTDTETKEENDRKKIQQKSMSPLEKPESTEVLLTKTYAQEPLESVMTETDKVAESITETPEEKIDQDLIVEAADEVKETKEELEDYKEKVERINGNKEVEITGKRSPSPPAEEVSTASLDVRKEDQVDTQAAEILQKEEEERQEKLDEKPALSTTQEEKEPSVNIPCVKKEEEVDTKVSEKETTEENEFILIEAEVQKENVEEIRPFLPTAAKEETTVEVLDTKEEHIVAETLEEETVTAKEAELVVTAAEEEGEEKEVIEEKPASPPAVEGKITLKDFDVEKQKFIDEKICEKAEDVAKETALIEAEIKEEKDNIEEKDIEITEVKLSSSSQTAEKQVTTGTLDLKKVEHIDENICETSVKVSKETILVEAGVQDEETKEQDEIHGVAEEKQSTPQITEKGEKKVETIEETIEKKPPSPETAKEEVTTKAPDIEKHVNEKVLVETAKETILVEKHIQEIAAQHGMEEKEMEEMTEEIPTAAEEKETIETIDVEKEEHIDEKICEKATKATKEIVSEEIEEEQEIKEITKEEIPSLPTQEEEKYIKALDAKREEEEEVAQVATSAVQETVLMEAEDKEEEEEKETRTKIEETPPIVTEDITLKTLDLRKEEHISAEIIEERTASEKELLLAKTEDQQEEEKEEQITEELASSPTEHVNREALDFKIEEEVAGKVSGIAVATVEKEISLTKKEASKEQDEERAESPPSQKEPIKSLETKKHIDAKFSEKATILSKEVVLAGTETQEEMKESKEKPEQKTPPPAEDVKVQAFDLKEEEYVNVKISEKTTKEAALDDKNKLEKTVVEMTSLATKNVTQEKEETRKEEAIEEKTVLTDAELDKENEGLDEKSPFPSGKIHAESIEITEKEQVTETITEQVPISMEAKTEKMDKDDVVLTSEEDAAGAELSLDQELKNATALARERDISKEIKKTAELPMSVEQEGATTEVTKVEAEKQITASDKPGEETDKIEKTSPSSKNEVIEALKDAGDKELIVTEYGIEGATSEAVMLQTANKDKEQSVSEKNIEAIVKMPSPGEMNEIELMTKISETETTLKAEIAILEREKLEFEVVKTDTEEGSLAKESVEVITETVEIIKTVQKIHKEEIQGEDETTNKGKAPEEIREKSPLPVEGFEKAETVVQGEAQYAASSTITMVATKGLAKEHETTKDLEIHSESVDIQFERKDGEKMLYPTETEEAKSEKTKIELEDVMPVELSQIDDMKEVKKSFSLYEDKEEQLVGTRTVVVKTTLLEKNNNIERNEEITEKEVAKTSEKVSETKIEVTKEAEVEEDLEVVTRKAVEVNIIETEKINAEVKTIKAQEKVGREASIKEQTMSSVEETQMMVPDASVKTKDSMEIKETSSKGKGDTHRTEITSEKLHEKLENTEEVPAVELGQIERKIITEVTDAPSTEGKEGLKGIQETKSKDDQTDETATTEVTKDIEKADLGQKLTEHEKLTDSKEVGENESIEIGIDEKSIEKEIRIIAETTKEISPTPERVESAKDTIIEVHEIVSQKISDTLTSGKTPIIDEVADSVKEIEIEKEIEQVASVKEAALIAKANVDHEPEAKDKEVPTAMELTQSKILKNEEEKKVLEGKIEAIEAQIQETVILQKEYITKISETMTTVTGDEIVKKMDSIEKEMEERIEVEEVECIKSEKVEKTPSKEVTEPFEQISQKTDIKEELEKQLTGEKRDVVDATETAQIVVSEKAKVITYINGTESEQLTAVKPLAETTEAKESDELETGETAEEKYGETVELRTQEISQIQEVSTSDSTKVTSERLGTSKITGKESVATAELVGKLERTSEEIKVAKDTLLAEKTVSTVPSVKTTKIEEVERKPEHIATETTQAKRTSEQTVTDTVEPLKNTEGKTAVIEKIAETKEKMASKEEKYDVKNVETEKAAKITKTTESSEKKMDVVEKDESMITFKEKTTVETLNVETVDSSAVQTQKTSRVREVEKETESISVGEKVEIKVDKSKKEVEEVEEKAASKDINSKKSYELQETEKTVHISLEDVEVKTKSINTQLNETKTSESVIPKETDQTIKEKVSEDEETQDIVAHEDIKPEKSEIIETESSKEEISPQTCRVKESKTEQITSTGTDEAKEKEITSITITGTVAQDSESKAMKILELIKTAETNTAVSTKEKKLFTEKKVLQDKMEFQSYDLEKEGESSERKKTISPIRDDGKGTKSEMDRSTEVEYLEKLSSPKGETAVQGARKTLEIEGAPRLVLDETNDADIKDEHPKESRRLVYVEVEIEESVTSLDDDSEYVDISDISEDLQHRTEEVVSTNVKEVPLSTGKDDKTMKKSVSEESISATPTAETTQLVTSVSVEKLASSQETVQKEISVSETQDDTACTKAVEQETAVKDTSEELFIPEIEERTSSLSPVKHELKVSDTAVTMDDAKTTVYEDTKTVDDSESTEKKVVIGEQLVHSTKEQFQAMSENGIKEFEHLDITETRSSTSTEVTEENTKEDEVLQKMESEKKSEIQVELVHSTAKTSEYKTRTEHEVAILTSHVIKEIIESESKDVTAIKRTISGETTEKETASAIDEGTTVKQEDESCVSETTAITTAVLRSENEDAENLIKRVTSIASNEEIIQSELEVKPLKSASEEESDTSFRQLEELSTEEAVKIVTTTSVAAPGDLKSKDMPDLSSTGITKTIALVTSAALEELDKSEYSNDKFKEEIITSTVSERIQTTTASTMQGLEESKETVREDDDKKIAFDVSGTAQIENVLYEESEDLSFEIEKTSQTNEMELVKECTQTESLKRITVIAKSEIIEGEAEESETEVTTTKELFEQDNEQEVSDTVTVITATKSSTKIVSESDSSALAEEKEVHEIITTVTTTTVIQEEISDTNGDIPEKQQKEEKVSVTNDVMTDSTCTKHIEKDTDDKDSEAITYEFSKSGTISEIVTTISTTTISADDYKIDSEGISSETKAEAATSEVDEIRTITTVTTKSSRCVLNEESVEETDSQTKDDLGGKSAERILESDSEHLQDLKDSTKVSKVTMDIEKEVVEPKQKIKSNGASEITKTIKITSTTAEKEDLEVKSEESADEKTEFEIIEISTTTTTETLIHDEKDSKEPDNKVETAQSDLDTLATEATNEKVKSKDPTESEIGELKFSATVTKVTQHASACTDSKDVIESDSSKISDDLEAKEHTAGVITTKISLAEAKEMHEISSPEVSKTILAETIETKGSDLTKAESKDAFATKESKYTTVESPVVTTTTTKVANNETTGEISSVTEKEDLGDKALESDISKTTDSKFSQQKIFETKSESKEESTVISSTMENSEDRHSIITTVTTTKTISHDLQENDTEQVETSGSTTSDRMDEIVVVSARDETDVVEIEKEEEEISEISASKSDTDHTVEMKPETATTLLKSEKLPDESPGKEPRKKKSKVIRKKIIFYQTVSDSGADDVLTEERIREALKEAGAKGTSSDVSRIISSGTTADLEAFSCQKDVIEIKHESVEREEPHKICEQKESNLELEDKSSKDMGLLEESKKPCLDDSLTLITAPLEMTFRRYSKETAREEEETESSDGEKKTEDVKVSKEESQKHFSEKEEDTSEGCKQSRGTKSELDAGFGGSGVRGKETKPFSLDDWGKPMGLPSPPEISETQVRQASVIKKSVNGVRTNNNNNNKSAVGRKDKDRSNRNISTNSDTSGNTTPNKEKVEEETNCLGNKTEEDKSPIYVDLTYVPHHGDPNYCNTDFFRRVRARYYVFSGNRPCKEVLNALLEAKQEWEDKEAKVTIVPTYETDTLGYWMSVHQDILTENHIDVAPSASRCTINLQDHETSCSAYRLEF